jgi:UDP-N-acetylglucosamine:LPS N-acetylglucosamine transferase
MTISMRRSRVLRQPVEAGVRARRVLAVASGGGHWMELRRLIPAFHDLDVAFVSVHANYASQVPGRRFYVIRDVSRRNPWDALTLVPQLLRIIWRERPDVVITTGSAPALVALLFARRLLGARTIWIDSIANVERLSSSGALARHVADVWLTQWPALRTERGPDCWGQVL